MPSTAAGRPSSSCRARCAVVSATQHSGAPSLGCGRAGLLLLRATHWKALPPLLVLSTATLAESNGTPRSGC